MSRGRRGVRPEHDEGRCLAADRRPAAAHGARPAELTIVEAALDDPRVGGLLGEWDRELGFRPRRPVHAGEFLPPTGVFLLATAAERPVGCGGLRRLDERTGEVKRLFVRDAARGHGAGRALLSALEARAAAAGFERLRLDTQGGEPAALALFRSAGYHSIPDYNGNANARFWFEKPLR